jgi:predicted SprT family Zn-dependent metalloprotease
VLLDVQDGETIALVGRYVGRLGLPTDRLRVTTDRRTFGEWIGRPVRSSFGGAYAYLPGSGEHAVLINLARIDRSQPRAVEIVVAEELIHMRDRLDGDRRRHAKHGYDRIARRVAALTGATLDEVRSCLLPVRSRPFRFVYACPACDVRVERRVRGAWSCGRCSPRYDPRYALVLVHDAAGGPGTRPG